MHIFVEGWVGPRILEFRRLIAQLSSEILRHNQHETYPECCGLRIGTYLIVVASTATKSVLAFSGMHWWAHWSKLPAPVTGGCVHVFMRNTFAFEALLWQWSSRCPSRCGSQGCKFLLSLVYA